MTRAARTVAAGFGLQCRLTRADPDYLTPLAVVPMFALVFVAIVRDADRPDLAPAALLAPVLMALWQLSLLASGELVDGDRAAGTLEPTVAAPASFAAVLLGRVAAVAAISLVSLVEVVAASVLFFGTVPRVEHPALFVIALAATVFAVAATGLVMASLFVLTRTARTFQNSLNYPFYVLGGVLVPVSFLPWWIRPASTVVFLSWSADLLRACLHPGGVERVAFRVAVIVALGVVTLALGFAMVARVLGRLRATGTIGFS